MMKRRNATASFTLVELLVVMVIIMILAALTVAAAGGVMTKAARSRAASEIQAVSTALESYKTDNGIYPISTNMVTNTYAASDGSGGLYQTSAQILYLSLSGQTNFTDIPVSGVKAYMSFHSGQVGTAAGGSYVQDPWGYSYGYSTGTTTPSINYPYNGNNFFDVWSTGGLLTAAVNTNAWISNWQ